MTFAQTLTTKDNWEILQRAQLVLESLGSQAPPLEKMGIALRKEGVSPEVAAAVTAQLQLRKEAEVKFGESAKHMLLTRDGLEQATRFPVSFLHALRYSNAGVSRVADLGCGIGADSVALCTAGVEVVALDKDPQAAACAATNLRDFPGAEVIVGDANEVDLKWLLAKDVGGVFLDPARRSAGKRVLKPSMWSPSWERVTEIFSWGLPSGVKVAPGIDHGLLGIGSHAQWTSVDGELVEAALWSSQLSPEGPGRSAQVLLGGTRHVLTDPETKTADAPVRPARVGDVDEFLYEPGPAVIRSGLIARAAEMTDTHLIHQRIAYLSGPRELASPYLTGFKVERIVPLRKKRVLQALRDLGAGPVEVKKRGADLNPAEWQKDLQKQLSAPQGRPLVVFATRTAGGHTAIIASRLQRTD